MLRALFWRTLLLGLGLMWLACAAADVYRIATEGGVFTWTLGTVHGLMFLLLGVGTCLGAFLIDPKDARVMLIEFCRDVFSRKNLIEIGTLFAVAILAALILVAIKRSPL